MINYIIAVSLYKLRIRGLYLIDIFFSGLCLKFLTTDSGKESRDEDGGASAWRMPMFLLNDLSLKVYI